MAKGHDHEMRALQFIPRLYLEKLKLNCVRSWAFKCSAIDIRDWVLNQMLFRYHLNHVSLPQSKFINEGL